MDQVDHFYFNFNLFLLYFQRLINWTSSNLRCSSEESSFIFTFLAENQGLYQISSLGSLGLTTFLPLSSELTTLKMNPFFLSCWINQSPVFFGQHDDNSWSLSVTLTCTLQNSDSFFFFSWPFSQWFNSSFEFDWSWSHMRNGSLFVEKCMPIWALGLLQIGNPTWFAPLQDLLPSTCTFLWKIQLNHSRKWSLWSKTAASSERPCILSGKEPISSLFSSLQADLKSSISDIMSDNLHGCPTIW